MRQGGRVQPVAVGKSRRACARGYWHEHPGALLAAHEHAFVHFGRCTAESLYDRMVTLGTAEGKLPVGLAGRDTALAAPDLRL